MGYLDLGYFHTGQLTAKSDVYSFGVVLAELLTGEKPVCFERSEDQRNVANYFTLAIKEKRLYRLLETIYVNEGEKEQVHVVAELANKCLSVNGDERPLMKEVAMELEGLRGFKRHHSVRNNNKETTSPTSEDVDLYDIPSSAFYNTNSTTGHYSSDTEKMQPMDIPR